MISSEITKSIAPAARASSLGTNLSTLCILLRKFEPAPGKVNASTCPAEAAMHLVVTEQGINHRTVPEFASSTNKALTQLEAPSIKAAENEQLKQVAVPYDTTFLEIPKVTAVSDYRPQ